MEPLTEAEIHARDDKAGAGIAFNVSCLMALSRQEERRRIATYLDEHGHTELAEQIREGAHVGASTEE